MRHHRRCTSPSPYLPGYTTLTHPPQQVQGKYDATKYFDHHQRTFAETFSAAHKTKLSSAGLIYKHFARNIIAHRLSLPADSPSTDLLYTKVYNDFIEALDANDNGIPAYPSDISPAFNDKSIALPSLVGSFNPSWNDPAPDQDAEDSRFLQASTLIGETFVRKLDFYGRSWLPARDLVAAAVDKRFEHDSKGRLLVFEQPIPWRDHLFTLEKELGIEEGPLYALYGEGPGKPGWRVQAVPVSKDSFESRKPLPEAWRGVRDEKLSEVTGVTGGVFVHASGFIGGNKSFEGALEMAKKALDL